LSCEFTDLDIIFYSCLWFSWSWHIRQLDEWLRACRSFDSSIECIICVWSQEKFSDSWLLHYVKRQAGGKSQKRLRSKVQSFRLCKRTHRSCGARYWHWRIDWLQSNIHAGTRAHTRGSDTYTFIALILLSDRVLISYCHRCKEDCCRRRHHAPTRWYVRASLI
jgi:hypothetical protein